MKKITALLALLVLFVGPGTASAQTVFAKNQLITPAIGQGVVMATSSSGTSKLTATSSPTLQSVTATSTTIQSFFPLANITKLSNLTSNGFVKTSSADGTLSVDTASYQTLDATLTALAAYNINGLLTQTAADTFTGRTITGTSNRLSVSNGNGVSGNPTLDIDAAYVGQTSITTLGTIGTGVWSATQIAIARGGTNATSQISKSLMWFDGTSITGTSSQPLTVGSVLATTTIASQLPYASSTAQTVTGSLDIPSNGVLTTNGELTLDDTSGQLRGFAGSAERVYAPFIPLSFGLATTTAGTGTTTLYLAPAIVAGTLVGGYCETDAGTFGISIYDGTNRATYIPTASTTPNFFAFSINNTFTAGETIRADVGTAASSPKKLSCRFKFTLTAD